MSFLYRLKYLKIPRILFICNIKIILLQIINVQFRRITIQERYHVTTQNLKRLFMMNKYKR